MARLSGAIMAHPKRERFIPELQASLDRDIPVVWDKHNDRWDTGRRALLAYDPEATHHLVIQDDAIACRDLFSGMEKGLEFITKKAAVGLYVGRSRPNRERVSYLVDQAEETGQPFTWIEMPQMNWGVGILLPVDIIEPLVEWGDKRPDISNYDTRVSRWLGHNEIPVWYPYPSLVDHRDSPSLVRGRQSRGRFAHSFLGSEASALEMPWTSTVVGLPHVVPAITQSLASHRRRQRYRQRQAVARRDIVQRHRDAEG